MTPALVILAVLVAAGGIVAVSAREPRFAALGMLVALIGAAFVADPLPAPRRSQPAWSAPCSVRTSCGLRSAGHRPPPPAGGWAGPAPRLSRSSGSRSGGWRPDRVGSTLAAADGDGPSVGAAAALAAGSRSPAPRSGPRSRSPRSPRLPCSWAATSCGWDSGCCSCSRPWASFETPLGSVPDGVVELALAVLTALSGAAVAGLVGRSLSIHGDLLLRVPQRDSSVRDPASRHRPTDEAHPRHLGTTPDGRVRREPGPGAHPLPRRDEGGWGGVS